MKQSEFIAKLKLAHDVPNYYNNHFPKNCGYYDGQRFSFDCWNLIKAILGGWTDNRTVGYYVSPKDFPTGDIDGYHLLMKCYNRSKDFTQLKQAGTYLYISTSPHAGIYIGDFQYQGQTFNVVECTGAWASKVQYTYVNDRGERYLYKGGQKSAYSWTDYGLLPWVEYESTPTPNKTEFRGIDVSSWQGVIDWKKVKASGISFAIIKAGGSDAGRYKDRYFETNYLGAKDNGIKVGAYYFNGKSCTSYEAGKADAQHFLSLISGKTFDYPCYSDLEAPTSATKQGNTDAVISFCETVKSAGFKCGVYASDISGFKDRLDYGRLSSYDKWVARYGSLPKYATDYKVWQYSSSGVIDGIKGRCDVDISYYDYSTPTVETYNLWGADFSPVFDPDFYSDKYPDLKEAFGDDHSALWVHFQTFGMNEARQASEEFNVNIYKDRYEDLRRVYGDNLPLYYWHYCYFGINEGRSGA